MKQGNCETAGNKRATTCLVKNLEKCTTYTLCVTIETMTLEEYTKCINASTRFIGKQIDY